MKGVNKQAGKVAHIPYPWHRHNFSKFSWCGILPSCLENLAVVQTASEVGELHDSVDGFRIHPHL
jgi:hypothetical protein